MKWVDYFKNFPWTKKLASTGVIGLFAFLATIILIYGQGAISQSLGAIIIAVTLGLSIDAYFARKYLEIDEYFASKYNKIYEKNLKQSQQVSGQLKDIIASDAIARKNDNNISLQTGDGTNNNYPLDDNKNQNSSIPVPDLTLDNLEK